MNTSLQPPQSAPLKVVSSASVPTNPAAATSTERSLALLTMIEVLALPALRWRIEKIIPLTGLGVMYGQPGSGKTFAALHLSMAIGAGEVWFGHATKKGTVVYIAGEGVSGFSSRLRAHMTAGPGFDTQLLVIPEPTPLPISKDSIVDGIKKKLADEKPAMIVVDTLARCFQGDENRGEDMSAFIQSCDSISKTLGCFVLIVHHSGKDAERGSRGHSSLKGALDVEIEVREHQGIHSLKIVKQKDGEKIEPIAFRLEQVQIGKNEDGQPVTSCVVRASDQQTHSHRPPLPKGGVQKLIYELAGVLLKESADMGCAGAPAGRPCIRLDTLQEKYRAIGTGRNAAPAYFNRTFSSMKSSGILLEKDGWVWCP